MFSRIAVSLYLYMLPTPLSTDIVDTLKCLKLAKKIFCFVIEYALARYKHIKKPPEAADSKRNFRGLYSPASASLLS